MSILEIKAKTVAGKKLGRTIGFPTLNIPYDGELSGVFVAEVFLADGGNYHLASAGTRCCLAAVNLGLRPTVDGKKLCEAYLIDWSGEVMNGAEVRVCLLQKIREIEKFESLDELKVQIAKDVEFARCWKSNQIGR